MGAGTSGSKASPGRRYEHFNDPSFQRWRTRPKRRRLVVLGLAYGIGISLFVVVLTSLLQGYVNLGLSLPITAGSWWWIVDLMRVSTRGLTALPPEILDERQREARADAFQRGYNTLFAAVVVLAALVFASRLLQLPDAALWVAILVVVFLGYAAPTLILAWTEPSEATESGD